MVFWRRWSSSEGHGSKEKTNNGRWVLSKIRFCRDDLLSNSTDISTSLRSCEAIIAESVAGDSEATVTLSTSDLYLTEEIKQTSIGEESKHQPSTEEENSLDHRSLGKENDSLAFQSAFRARRESDQMGEFDQTEEMENFSRASSGTSTEVQAGESVKNLKFQRETNIVQQRMQHKDKTVGFRLKEEWDASTVSNNISKLRLQSRLEAINKRERALAYALSQQRRTRTIRREPIQQRIDVQGMGWSWLERWTATGLPENYQMEDDFHSNLIESISCEPCHGSFRRSSDVAAEEMESCGSNDVSVNFDSFSASTQSFEDQYTPVKKRLRAPTNASRRNSRQNYGYGKQMKQVKNPTSRFKPKYDHITKDC